MRMRTFASWVVTLLLLPPAYAASLPGDIHGVVRDSEGQPVAGAQVLVHSVDENTDHAVLSAMDGAFLVKGLKPGQYHLTASKEGCRFLQDTTVKIASAESLAVEVTLTIPKNLVRVMARPAPHRRRSQSRARPRSNNRVLVRKATEHKHRRQVLAQTILHLPSGRSNSSPALNGWSNVCPPWKPTNLDQLRPQSNLTLKNWESRPVPRLSPCWLRWARSPCCLRPGRRVPRRRLRVWFLMLRSSQQPSAKLPYPSRLRLLRLRRTSFRRLWKLPNPRLGWIISPPLLTATLPG